MQAVGPPPPTGVNDVDYQGKIVSWMIENNVPIDQADEINMFISQQSTATTP